jgi:amino acid adenylation domain-containing protein
VTVDLTRAVPQLHDFLEQSARRSPRKVALVAPAGRFTYSQLDLRANALAHLLIAKGVERGERVVIYADNGVDAVVAFWAVLKANAVACFVSPLTRSAALARLLNDCGATAVVSHRTHAPAFREAVVGCRSLKAVVVSDGLRDADREKMPIVVDWLNADSDDGADGPPLRANLDVDLAALIYTSGSTGVPKGVMLTHRNMITAANSVAAYLGMSERDVVLCVLPLSFDYGLYQMIMTFAAGATLVLERSFAFPTSVLRTIEREQVTAFPGVPTIFAMMMGMKNLDRFDLSSVCYVTSTAAYLPPSHIGFLREIFPAARIFSMYGLTECKRCTYLPPEDLERKPGSVGIPIPNTEVWVVDDQGRRLGPNQVGQLVVRGATVMQGYWRQPEATARRLKPGALPGERLLYTGDYCRLDEDGYLYFVGRMDDIIKSCGEKVAPKEVETVLLSIQGVVEAAVVGVPDAVLGQEIRAFVVIAPGVRLTDRHLRLECQAQLESFKVPRQIVVLDALPRTGSGKVDKLALCGEHAPEAAGGTPMPQGRAR